MVGLVEMLKDETLDRSMASLGWFKKDETSVHTF